MELKNTGQVDAQVRCMCIYCMSEVSSYIFSSWTVAQCCPWFLPWPVSSPNYRYTNQTGRSINSERRSPLISDLEKSYIKYL